MRSSPSTSHTRHFQAAQARLRSLIAGFTCSYKVVFNNSGDFGCTKSYSAKSPGMCWEASVWLGGWWRWSVGRPWRPSRSPTDRSSLETDAFPGLPGATSANGGHVAATAAARLFTSKADPLQARGQPGVDCSSGSSLVSPEDSISLALDLLEQPNTASTQPRSRTWTQQQTATEP